MNRKILNSAGLLSAAILFQTGCTSMSETRKRDLNRTADSALTKVVLEQPGLQAEIGISAGYLVIERSGSGIPMVGKRGVGVLVDQINNERSFVTITKLEVDGAWGVGDYTGVMSIRDAQSLKRAKAEGLTLENKGTIFIYVKGESSAAYPVKIISMEPKEG
ncbi:hypothetical protein P4B35_19060 [Pontiellaceae bacterium B12227]|nr:hypothetical protein [Pontiellaceae bacterium B12227]